MTDVGRHLALALAPAGAIHRPPTGTGPLDGVRVAVKDLYDVAGTVTGAGNPTLAEGPPAPADAAAVAELLGAGAELVAKTATDELAMGMFGVNTHYGTPPNPAAPDRVPGGSSSGSASLVAGGRADLGLGTDTGGSVRVPAAFCGLVGLRPTHGRIDIAGVRPMAADFDTVGLMARDVELVARGLGQLTAEVPPRPVRTLLVLSDLLAVADHPVAARTEATAARWADQLGLDLRHGSLLSDGEPQDLVEVFWPLMSRQLWQANGSWLTAAQPTLGAGIAERIRAAGTVDDDAVANARGRRSALRDRLGELLGDAVAVLPTTWAPPPLRTTPHDQLMAWRDRNLRLLVPASLTGAPQLTVPAGTIGDAGQDVPVAVSLLGLPNDDELLVAMARETTAVAGATGSGDG